MTEGLPNWDDIPPEFKERYRAEIERWVGLDAWKASHKALLWTSEEFGQVMSMGPLGMAAKYGPDVDERAIMDSAAENLKAAIEEARKL